MRKRLPEILAKVEGGLLTPAREALGVAAGFYLNRFLPESGLLAWLAADSSPQSLLSFKLAMRRLEATAAKGTVANPKVLAADLLLGFGRTPEAAEYATRLEASERSRRDSAQGTAWAAAPQPLSR